MNTAIHLFKRAVCHYQDDDESNTAIASLKRIERMINCKNDPTTAEQLADDIRMKMNWPSEKTMADIVADSGYMWWHHEIGDESFSAIVTDVSTGRIDVRWQIKMPDGSICSQVAQYSRKLTFSGPGWDMIHTPPDTEGWEVGEEIPVAKNRVLWSVIHNYIAEKDKDWQTGIINLHKNS